MKIKNFDVLATTEGRTHALRIAERGLAAIDTRAAVKSMLSFNGETLSVSGRSFPVKSPGRVFVVAVGKCACEAAAAIEEILGDAITDGVALDVRKGLLLRITTYQGTHPFPSEGNIAATKAILSILSGLTPDDLVLFAISGGGSTLLCQPEHFTAEDEACIAERLMKRSAPIREVNTVRKHLSRARGGYLAQYAYPARVISLIFSDIPGKNMEFVASGPTMLDTTTVEDAKRVLQEYDIGRCGWFSIDKLIETPKDPRYFEGVWNVETMTNGVALGAMASEAVRIGFHARVVTQELSGEARDVGAHIVQDLRGTSPRTALLYGGETTVKVTGSGKGGRNQELGLSALQSIEKGFLILPFASDGRDNSDIGGVICDAVARDHAAAKGLDMGAYLRDNRSYEFWSGIGDYLSIVNTGSNVADLIIALHE